MTTAEIVIKNKSGLHARPAAMFTKEASKFKSTITIENLKKRGTKVSAKSIMKVLTLSISQGTGIVISADGEDETEAIKALKAIVEEGFGEL